ncbi:asparagine synthase-related protein [bacterium]|nr:asparagine synthase-related protein [bacterium]
MKKFVGPFAVVIYDRKKDSIVAVRDPLGDRTLFYSHQKNALLIASEERALLQDPDVNDQLDETRIATYFAFEPPPFDGSTFFKDIKELLPGHLISFENGHLRVRQYFNYEFAYDSKLQSDEEYAEQYRDLFQQSVQSRLRCIGRPAVMMSGGLDSTSVAAVAARNMNDRLKAVSWRFKELASCDEGVFINKMIEKYEIDPFQFCADNEWPLRNYENWPINPSTPVSNSFRMLKERAFRTASESGSRIVLVGTASDKLYSGTKYWLTDLLHYGNFRQAIRDTVWHVTRKGIRNFFQSTAFKGSLILKRFSPNWKPPAPDWLTDYARNLLPERVNWPVQNKDPIFRSRHNHILGLFTAHNFSVEIPHASRCGVDVRDPYRDRRLVDFMLSIPLNQLYRRGVYKIVLRNAMLNILPEEIRTRTTNISLKPLHSLGFRKESERIRRLLTRTDRVWPKYVSSDWLEQTPMRNRSSMGKMVDWLCISFDEWMHRFGRTIICNEAA